MGLSAVFVVLDQEVELLVCLVLMNLEQTARLNPAQRQRVGTALEVGVLSV